MTKSQLKQLKIALKNAGISTGNRRTKKKKKQVDQTNRISILEDIRSQFNHYEKKVNKIKYEVSGRKLKGIEGRPGLSRQVGEEKRKKTILVNMLRKNKEGGIIDRRFGEHNTHLSLDDKMLQRYTMEKQRLYKKNCIYNLEDDDLEDFDDSLTEIEDFIDTKNLDNKKGDIDFETVNEKHFGGFKNLKELNKKKSKSQIMKEIIAKSKLQKYQKQKIKEDDDIERETLDAELNDLRLLLSKNTQIASPKTEKKQLNEDKDMQYDLNVKELAYEKRVCSSSRTKTDEEIAREKAEELHKLEGERIKRMKYENSLENEDIEEINFFFPRNNLEGDFVIDNDSQTDNDTEFYSFEKETPEKFKHKKTNEIFHHENSIEDASIFEKSGDMIKNIDTCNDITSEFSNIISMSSDNPQHLHLDKKKRELAYIYPCPRSISEFLSILKNIQQEDIPEVVNRIKILYHPSLHPLNKQKLQSFIAVLLDLILYLSEKKKASLCTLDILSEHLRDLSDKYPETSYETFYEKLKRLRGRFDQLLSSEKKIEFIPLIQDLVLLRIIGTIFPTSDLSHAIIAPTLLIMGQLLSQLKIISLGDIALKLYIITLFAEYINSSQRIVPEAIYALLNIIKILFQKSKKNLSEEKNPIESKNNFFNLSNKPRILKISDIYSNSDDDKELKVSLFKTAAQLIDYYANLWSGKLAFIEFFSPCLNLLKTFSSKIYLSPELQMEINSINERIAKLLQFSSQSRKPLILQAHKPIPIPSHIPKFEKEYSLDKKSYDPNHSRAESKKLRFQYRDTKKSTIRMLRLDSQFIGRETEKVKREKDIEYAMKMKKIYGQLSQKE
ncbi:hypothetical protein PCANB_000138 [Pneumocystis canis]|nr:hypothetical protein PCANB_000138 [Pneumocystis canis]